MSKTAAVVVCAVAGVLGLLSVVLGFAAEATKVKSSQIVPDSTKKVCVFPSSPSAMLGFASAVFLLVAFIMLNVANKCYCCYKRHDPYASTPTSRSACNLALFYFIFSWIFFVVAFLQMVVAAGSSSKGNMEKLRVSQIGTISYYSCYYVKPGVFAYAAFFAFMSVAFGINCRLKLAGTGGPSSAAAPHGITLGQQP